MNKKNRKRSFKCCLISMVGKMSNKLTQSEFLISYLRTQLEYPHSYVYFSSTLESHHQI